MTADRASSGASRTGPSVAGSGTPSRASNAVARTRSTSARAWTATASSTPVTGTTTRAQPGSSPTPNGTCSVPVSISMSGAVVSPVGAPGRRGRDEDLDREEARVGIAERRLPARARGHPQDVEPAAVDIRQPAADVALDGRPAPVARIDPIGATPARRRAARPGRPRRRAGWTRHRTALRIADRLAPAAERSLLVAQPVEDRRRRSPLGVEPELERPWQPQARDLRPENDQTHGS